MKILVIHSQLHDLGGDTLYSLRLADLLRAKGHEVELWGMYHVGNIPHTYSQYDADEINFKTTSLFKNPFNAFKNFYNSIYSSNAKKKLQEVLKKYKPDIVHIQSIHYYLTTSIIDEIYNFHIPIVWTQHNFALVCCNFMLKNDRICEKCKPNKFYSPIITRCKKNSLLPSIAGSLQLYRDYLSGVYKKVNKFVAITEFYLEKFQQFGFEREKFVLIPNFFESLEYIENNNLTSDYILYFGRLSPEKGVSTLIKAMSLMKDYNLKLKIAGDGPQRKELEQLILSNKLDNIFFLGKQEKDQLSDIIKNSLFTIVPSIWYENFPNAILESYSFFKPVVGSKIGGIPEMIYHEKTGLLFEPGNYFELAENIKILLHNSEERNRFGKNGNELLHTKFSPENHYKKLLDVYTSIIQVNN